MTEFNLNGRQVRTGTLAADQLVTPEDSAVILIDHQPAMLFAIESHQRADVARKAALLAKTATIFNIPTVLSTIAAEGVAGPLIPEIVEAAPDVPVVDRPGAINAWEDDAFVTAVEATGRHKLIMSGLWTEACLLYPALSAQQAGYQVYAVADASGGATEEAHRLAMDRMTQAGIIPVTVQSVLFELYRDWSRQEHYAEVLEASRVFGDAYGQFINYFGAMVLPHRQDEQVAG
jgi:nicotinamidase-related amidase